MLLLVCNDQNSLDKKKLENIHLMSFYVFDVIYNAKNAKHFEIVSFTFFFFFFSIIRVNCYVRFFFLRVEVKEYKVMSALFCLSSYTQIKSINLPFDLDRVN